MIQIFSVSNYQLFISIQFQYKLPLPSINWVFKLKYLMNQDFICLSSNFASFLTDVLKCVSHEACMGITEYTVYPKKYAHGFCFAVLCCGYALTDFPISIRLTSLALWQSNDCPSASKATLMNMDKYFMWIHYERLRNHNKAKHNKTVCIFLGIYCMSMLWNYS